MLIKYNCIIKCLFCYIYLINDTYQNYFSFSVLSMPSTTQSPNVLLSLLSSLTDFFTLVLSLSVGKQ